MRRRQRAAEHAVSCQVWTSTPVGAPPDRPPAPGVRALRIEVRGPREALVQAQVLAVSAQDAVAVLEEVLQDRLRDPDAVVPQWRTVRRGRFLPRVTWAYGSLATGHDVLD